MLRDTNNKKKHFVIVGKGGGGGGTQVQSDWAQTDDTQPDYIKNKPELDNTWFGTQAEFDALVGKNPNIIYYIEDTSDTPEYLTVGYKVINNPDTFQIISNTNYISGWRYKGETEWRTPVAEITVNDYYGTIYIEFNLIDNTKVGDSMFREISGSRITEVELPASVTTIENDAFFRCGYMGMPNLQNVTSIGDNTFYGVGVFEKSDYILNNSVDYSGWKVSCFNADYKVWWTGFNAPYNCYVNGDVYNVRVDSQDIDLTNGINGLPIYRFRAFILNTSLNSIKFPATLTSIVGSAFNEATITDLYFYGTTPPVSELYGDASIWKGSNITNIYVPAEALSAYQNSPDFADVVSKIQAMP